MTNIASGAKEHTEALIRAGTVEHLMPLLSCSDLEVRGQAVWALANISGDGPEPRDYVLRLGVMQPLLALLMAPNPTSRVLRDATWMLSNLCRGKDAPWDIIQTSIPVLSRLLYSADNDVLGDACWALLFITESDPSRGHALLQDGIGPQLVSLLRHPSRAIQLPALRVVGNILLGDEEDTQALLNMNVLIGLEFLLKISDSRTLRKEVCWTISNITAGNTSQIQTIIDHAFILDALVSNALTSDDQTKIESCHALSNAFNGGSFDQIRQLVSAGAVESLAANLDTQDDRAMAVMLEAIEHLLIAGRKDPKVPQDYYILQLEHSGAVDKLEDLHMHKSEDIYQHSVRILRTFWPAADDNENASPNLTADGTYNW